MIGRSFAAISQDQVLSFKFKIEDPGFRIQDLELWRQVLLGIVYIFTHVLESVRYAIMVIF